ncbi:hypothetical protein CPB84DRAFT_1850561 [Gymnopilus junonius]|uniref:Uncharacterized protein n=1 Tax=Gymnopilus junonius TaxID=109634 RepID=A0A9P5TIF7_GYMJU|nr:hypothetical protein CPB84DRAFT_1850561 [Gymnopilus junonius]
MSQRIAHYLTTITASLLCSLKRIVLPYRLPTDNVLCLASRPTLGHKWRQHRWREADTRKQLSSTRTGNGSRSSEWHHPSRWRHSRRELDNFFSNPDQSSSQAPTVSLSTAATSSDQRTNTAATGTPSSISNTGLVSLSILSTPVPSTSKTEWFPVSNTDSTTEAATTSYHTFTSPLSSTSTPLVVQSTSFQPYSIPSSSLPPSTTSLTPTSSSATQALSPPWSSRASSTPNGIVSSSTSSMDGYDPVSPPPSTTATTTSQSRVSGPPSTSLSHIIASLTPTLPSTVSQEPSSTHDTALRSSIPLASSSLSSHVANSWKTRFSSYTSSHFRDKTSLTTSSPPTYLTSPLNFPPTTVFFTTTVTSGHDTIISTVIQTGVLSTDTAKPSRLAGNTGAVVGIVFSGIFGLLIVVLLLFFGCKRYRSRRNNFGSMDNILALARETTHRQPLDGDDESFLNGSRRSHSARHGALLSSHDHATELGDLRSAEGGGQGSAESGNLGTAVPMNTTFGGEPSMAGFLRGVEGGYTGQDAIASTDQHIQDPAPGQVWWAISDPNAVDDAQRKSSTNDDPVTASRSQSIASLTMVGGSSSSGHEVASSAGHGGRASRKRNSLPGPRPAPSHVQNGRRYSSPPPSSFINFLDSKFDSERQSDPPEQSDKTSLKSFMSRLRTGRRKSAQSVSTIRGTSPPTRELDEFPLFSSVPNMISPSLLNPPIVVQPSPALLAFPRSVTGNSYAHTSSPQEPPGANRPASVLWPPVVLPPPSPVMTENSVMGEGLLHPRLSRYGNSQASTASLRDHEDYTRPINAIVFNRNRSTATIETQGTTDSEKEGPKQQV